MVSCVPLSFLTAGSIAEEHGVRRLRGAVSWNLDLNHSQFRWHPIRSAEKGCMDAIEMSVQQLVRPRLGGRRLSYSSKGLPRGS